MRSAGSTHAVDFFPTKLVFAAPVQRKNPRALQTRYVISLYTLLERAGTPPACIREITNA
jgi:hypothetical protein